MTRIIYRKMHDLSAKRSCISELPKTEMHDPGQSLAVTGFSGKTSENAAEPMHDLGSCNTPEFVLGPKAAKLIGCDPLTITRQCKSGKYEGAKKVPVDGVEVWQIPIPSLPPSAQMMMLAEVKAALVEKAASRNLPTLAQTSLALDVSEYRALWDAYERSGAATKRKAELALTALHTFHDLVDTGFHIEEATKAVASKYGVSKATLWRYRTRTDGHGRGYWLGSAISIIRRHSITPSRTGPLSQRLPLVGKTSKTTSSAFSSRSPSSLANWPRPTRMNCCSA